MNAAQKAQHAARVQAAIDQYRKPEQFLVIEKATGKPVGDGKPMCRSFADYVIGVRDTFRNGEFFLQPV